MQEDARDVWEAFRPFFEDPRILKTWHNYSFDRHVMYNMHQLDCRGLAGDTMHMARLWSSSRKGKLNYSLESLSGCVLAPRCMLSAQVAGLPPWH